MSDVIVYAKLSPFDVYYINANSGYSGTPHGYTMGGYSSGYGSSTPVYMLPWYANDKLTAVEELAADNAAKKFLEEIRKNPAYFTTEFVAAIVQLNDAR